MYSLARNRATAACAMVNEKKAAERVDAAEQRLLARQDQHDRGAREDEDPDPWRAEARVLGPKRVGHLVHAHRVDEPGDADDARVGGGEGRIVAASRPT